MGHPDPPVKDRMPYKPPTYEETHMEDSPRVRLEGASPEAERDTRPVNNVDLTLEELRDMLMDALEERIQARPAAPAMSGDIYQALAKAQANFQPVIRSRKVIVKPRESAAYEFSYAPLENVLSSCLPALNAEGFWFTQEIVRGTDGKLDCMETRLHHQLGTIKNLVPMFIQFAQGQSYNSASTYARRLGATLLFGVASEDDDDGNITRGNDHTITPVRPGTPSMAEQLREQTVAQEKPKDAGGRYTPGKNSPKAPVTTGEKPPEEPVKVISEIEQARLEGLVRDAHSDMIDACVEGRSIGIQQIWDECKKTENGEYVCQRLWAEMKTTPDLFRTMKNILKPDDKQGPRGPKEKASANSDAKAR